MHKAVYILTVATYIYTHMRVWHDCMQWDTCVRAFEVVLLSDFFPSSADEPFSAQYLIVKLLVALLRASPHSFWKKNLLQEIQHFMAAASCHRWLGIPCHWGEKCAWK